MVQNLRKSMQDKFQLKDTSNDTETHLTKEEIQKAKEQAILDSKPMWRHPNKQNQLNEDDIEIFA